MSATVLTIITAATLVSIVIGVSAIYIVQNLRWQPRPIDEVEKALSSLLEAFQREATDLTSQYAEEFALVKFLEKVEAEGDAVDTSQFKAGTLNRVNLLRVQQLGDAISRLVAAKTVLAKQLSGTIDGSRYTYGNPGQEIARLKKQIGIEEEYISSLQDQLRSLIVYVVPSDS